MQINEIPKNIIDAAVRGSLTKTSARELIRNTGLRPIGRVADKLIAFQSHCTEQRNNRHERRIIARLGYCPVEGIPYSCVVIKRQPTHGINKGVRRLIKHGTLEERLTERRKKAAQITYLSAFRTPGDYHGNVSVILTNDPSAVGVTQTQRKDWNLYKGKFKGWAATVTNTAITVPADWRMRVQRRGLAVLDGMMTLDASYIEGAPHGVELYAATWISQGRGYAVNTHQGVIAITGQQCELISHHAEDAQKAMAGLKRKLEAARWVAKLAARDLSALVAEYGAMIVRIADAKACGACEYGIKSWCYRTGLSYNAGAATLKEVYDAYQQSPAPEARAAMLHALRRRNPA